MHQALDSIDTTVVGGDLERLTIKGANPHPDAGKIGKYRHLEGDEHIFQLFSSNVVSLRIDLAEVPEISLILLLYDGRTQVERNFEMVDLEIRAIFSIGTFLLLLDPAYQSCGIFKRADNWRRRLAGEATSFVL